MIGGAGAAIGAGGAAGTAGAASSTGFGGSGGGAGATIGEGASAGATMSGAIGFFFTGSSFGFGSSIFGFSTSSFGVIRLTMMGTAEVSASRAGAYWRSATSPATWSATTPTRLGALVRSRCHLVVCGSSSK